MSPDGRPVIWGCPRCRRMLGSRVGRFGGWWECERCGVKFKSRDGRPVGGVDVGPEIRARVRRVMPEPLTCISLWQPWATLWAAGVKRIETRSWVLRGPFPRRLAVHAAKRMDAEIRDTCRAEPFRSALADLGYRRPEDLPLGKIVGVVTVVHVQQYGLLVPPPPYPERAFGDHGDGRWGWVSEDARMLPDPVAERGRMYLWDLPPDVLAAVEAQLTAAAAG